MRLDKFLTEAALGSRSQVKDLIRGGQVRVNGEIVKKPEYKISEGSDRIECQLSLIHI